MNLDELVAPIRSDVIQGASAIVGTAGRVIKQLASDAPFRSLPLLRAGVAELGVRILDAQPAMAPLVSLSAGTLTVLDGLSSVESGRHAVVASVDTFLEAQSANAASAAAQASSLLPADATVLTLSFSSTVLATLALARAGSIEVICLESRPLNEGRLLAERLAELRIPVTVAVDSAAQRMVERANVTLLGADSIGDRGVVNKIGSAALAHFANRGGLPVLVVAESSKLLPPGFPQELHDPRATDEVWRPGASIGVWNQYFEALPPADVTRFVTEAGPASWDDLQAQRTSLPVPPEIGRWADSRRPRGGPTSEEPGHISGV